MVRLHILLKNGKEVTSSSVPLMQAILWREQLKGRNYVEVPTWNGRARVFGPSVKTFDLESEGFTTDEVASAMYLDPCMIYSCEGAYYQYSDVSGAFEQAIRRNGFWLWTPAALPEGRWNKCGKGVL